MNSQQSQLLAQAIEDFIRNSRTSDLPVVVLHDTIANEFVCVSSVQYCSDRRECPSAYEHVRALCHLEHRDFRRIINLIDLDCRQPVEVETVAPRIVTIAEDGIGTLAGRMFVNPGSRSAFVPSRKFLSRTQQYAFEMLTQCHEPASARHLYELVSLNLANSFRPPIGRRVFMNQRELNRAARRISTRQIWCRIDDRTPKSYAAIFIFPGRVRFSREVSGLVTGGAHAFH